MKNITAFISGLVFAIGLGISGMMDPNKVIAFLDLTGQWDPSLALVMGGALVVTFISFPIITKRNVPVYCEAFYMPNKSDLDWKLISGSILFGAGWGVAGFCPGPAIANLLTLNSVVLTFIGFMLIGMFLVKILKLN